MSEGPVHPRSFPLSSTVLVIDDMSRDLKLVSNALKEHGIRPLVARSGKSGLERAVAGQPDLILLDAIMPDLDGFETCRRLKSDPRTQDIPVIFMTSLESTEDKVNAFQSGAVDYVTKPIHSRELLARVDAHLRLRALTRGLERLVEERTADLVQTNRRLEREIAGHERTAIELVRARKDAEAGNRAKSLFLGNMNHELHTPLNTIFGYAQLVQMSAEELGLDDETFKVPVAEILRGAQRLLDMITQVLTLSARESDELSVHRAVFEASEAILEAAGPARRLAAETGNRFELSCPRPLGPIYSDRQKLVEILGHLLDNAAKFTRDGEIRLAATRQESPGVEPGAWLVIEVSDTGRGIAEAALGDIFRPFMQVDDSATRERSGVGIGLTLVKYYCDSLAGEIRVNSTLARGSTFTVRIPWEQREEPRPSERDAQASKHTTDRSA